jgi:predicted dehydrogenase
MSRPTTAVIGTGFIGPVHVEALRRLGVPVAGILGSTPDKSQAAAARLGLPRGYESLDELLADPAVAVVHITSPNQHHFEHAKRVLEAGKHVVCEKPLAMTAAESAELVRLAAPLPVAAAVCYNIRYYPLNREAKGRLANLGPVRHVTGSYFQDWLLKETDFNWRVLAGQGGALRAVADIGTHWLDLVTWITGLEVEAVCADLATFLPTRMRPAGGVETFSGKLNTCRVVEPVAIDTEDYGSVLIRFHGGARGNLTVSQMVAGRKNAIRYEIAAGNGSLTWDGERPNELHLGSRDNSNEMLLRDPSLLSADARRFADYPGGHNEGFPDTFKQLFKSVYDYIAADDYSAERPFPTFADGHKEIVLCEAILRSAHEGTWVKMARSAS